MDGCAAVLPRWLRLRRADARPGRRRYLGGNPPQGAEAPQQQRPATRSTASLPPAFRDLFPGFRCERLCAYRAARICLPATAPLLESHSRFLRHFNSLQEAMFDTAFSSLVSFAVSAPTGAGKTVRRPVLRLELRS